MTVRRQKADCDKDLNFLTVIFTDFGGQDRHVGGSGDEQMLPKAIYCEI